MPEWWEGATAILALLVSAAAVIYARKEAIAADKVKEIEQGRERERMRPEIRPSFSDWIKEPVTATFVLENEGTQVIDRAEIRVLSGDDEARLIGFGDDTDLADRVREFGPLKPGNPVETTFLVSDPDREDDLTVKMLAIYTMGDDTWGERVEVELPSLMPFVG